MTYVTMIFWRATELSDETIATSNEKYLPLIKSVGATGVRMVRTGNLSFCVITEYADSATAQAAQSKIDEIRFQAASELPITLVDVQSGDVVAGSY